MGFFFYYSDHDNYERSMMNIFFFLDNDNNLYKKGNSLADIATIFEQCIIRTSKKD